MAIPLVEDMVAAGETFEAMMITVSCFQPRRDTREVAREVGRRLL